MCVYNRMQIDYILCYLSPFLVKAFNKNDFIFNQKATTTNCIVDAFVLMGLGMYPEITHCNSIYKVPLPSAVSLRHWSLSSLS